MDSGVNHKGTTNNKKWDLNLNHYINDKRIKIVGGM